MVKLRKLFFTALVLVTVFFGFDYFKLHTNSDVIAFKRFSQAVLKGDDYVARMTSTPEVASAAFGSSRKREESFRNLQRRFSYVEILSRFEDPGGLKVEITAELVSRVSRPGDRTPWGDAEVRLYQKAKLEKRSGLWRVVSFEDSAMRK